MKKTVVDSFYMISALGDGVEHTFDQLLKGKTGVIQHYIPSIDDQLAWISLVNENEMHVPDGNSCSHYERLLIHSILGIQKNSTVDLSGSDTLFVFSTTKGSISFLETEPFDEGLKERMSLNHSAEVVSTYFKNKNKPVVISNACISGVVALLYAKRILESGSFKHVLVAGADTITRFVYSGFQSFQALSPELCHPFSAGRDGINLGEAGAAILLSVTDGILADGEHIYIESGSVTNDSNHISGPSRTGEELSHAIDSAIKLSNLTPGDIDFISGHGTATPFNDEMEAKAFHLSGLQNTPVNSLKGYFGHTLGAAGLVESAISMMSLLKNVAVASKGFQQPSVEPHLNVIEQPLYKPLKNCLKTASGFGGCNSAIVFSKN